MYRIYNSASIQSCFRVTRTTMLSNRILSRTLITETRADAPNIPHPEVQPLSSISSTSTASSPSSLVRPKEGLSENYKKTAIEYSYFVPRNSNGSVPVYSDIRNGRTKHLTLIRNVEGNVQALKTDLIETLFPDTPDYQFDKQQLEKHIQVRHNRHVVMQGGQWVRQVQKWLIARGF